MPTQFEEIIFHSHTLHSQHLPPDSRQHLLYLRPRLLVLSPALFLLFRLQATPSCPLSRSPSAATAPTSRYAAGTMYSGNLSLRSLAAVPLTSPALFSFLPPPHSATSRFSPGPSSRATTTALRHSGMLTQPRLDLSQLDPIPSNLHLIIHSPHELDLPVRPPPPTSPVRYIRSPSLSLNGSGTNLSAVISAALNTLAPPAPPIYISPSLPSAQLHLLHPARRSACSPADRRSARSSLPPAPRIPQVTCPTVVSVGPYVVDQPRLLALSSNSSTTLRWTGSPPISRLRSPHISAPFPAP